MHTAKTDYSITFSGETGHPVRLFLTACHTFASNVVERLHEFADARLAEDLTIAEQRKRLLARSPRPARDHAQGLTPRTAHVE